MKMMMKSSREVNDKLANTWESLTDIERQYTDVDNGLSDESALIIEYINTLDEFDKKVFYLYTEYNSYRKVSDETNRGKDVIMQVINEIRENIKNKKHITEEK